MAIQLQRKLFTIEEYERMIATGVLAEDDRLELIRGEIVEMTPIGLEHIVCVLRLDHLFGGLVAKSAHTSVQNPIRLPNGSRPQPDVTILKWRDDFYAGKHPDAEDVLLLIEVADSTLETDRGVKVPLYAEAGIPETWIINLPERVVEVYSGPSAGAYGKIRHARRGDSLPLPAGLEGVVRVDDILG